MKLCKRRYTRQIRIHAKARMQFNGVCMRDFFQIRATFAPWKGKLECRTARSLTLSVCLCLCLSLNKHVWHCLWPARGPEFVVGSGWLLYIDPHCLNECPRGYCTCHVTGWIWESKYFFCMLPCWTQSLDLQFYRAQVYSILKDLAHVNGICRVKQHWYWRRIEQGLLRSNVF